MKIKIIFSITAILFLLIVGALYFYHQDKVTISNIQSFDECKENGFPVQPSSPALCMTPDGRTFAEEPKPISTDPHVNLIRIDTPKSGDVVESPILINGQARGYWFFEASFPVELVDSGGRVIAQAPARAKGDWMTENFVPFSLSFSYHSTSSQSATLILHKDNPSGLPENDDSISIPIKLGATK